MAPSATTASPRQVPNGSQVTPPGGEYWFQYLMPGKWVQLGDLWCGEVEFTPRIWEQVLANHDQGNRPLRRYQVATLSRALKNGEWLFTGESIIFSKDKYLINGRHRATACIETGIPFKGLVVVGVEPIARTALDQGARRALKDALHSLGCQHTNTLDSATSHVFKFCTFGEISQAHMGIQATIPERLAFFQEQHQDLALWVSKIRSVKGGSIFKSPGLASALFYLFDLASVNLNQRGLAEKMLQAFLDNEWPKDGGGLCWVSPKSMYQMLATRDQRAETAKGMFQKYMIKSWNNLVSGDDKRLSYYQKEGFPRISGIVYGEDGKPVL